MGAKRRFAWLALPATLLLAHADSASAGGSCGRGSVYRAGATASQPLATTTAPTGCGVETGYATSETTVAVTNGGAIVFSPAGSENSVARSTNGTGWTLSTPASAQRTHLWNTVDPQVVVDRRTGRLFWAHTTYANDVRWPLPDQSAASWLVPLSVADAHGFQVFSSVNDGASWTTADYRNEPTADWEKLFVGPPPRGDPKPSGYPDVVYLCANSPMEVIGPGRVCYRSLDGGATFQQAGYVDPSAVAPAGCPALAQNTGVVASDGTVYIPQSCAHGTYLAASRDEGRSYGWLPVPGAPSASGLGAVVQLAIDAADNLYVLWTAGDALELTRSSDGGRSWTAPLTVSPPGLHDITLPALAAGPGGSIGIAFYATPDPTAKSLNGYITETSDALSPEPLFRSAAVNDPAHPIFQNYGDSDSPRADFVGAAYDAHGRLWAGLVKQLGPPNSSSEIATTGYVGRLTP